MGETAEQKATAEKATAEKAAPAPAPVKTIGRGTKAYRFKSEVGDHFVDGAPLQPGQVVQLTATQVAAFADKFEPA